MTGRSLALVLAVLSAVLLGAAAPAAAGEVGDAAIVATDSAQLNRSSKVTGDVAVNNASTQTLVPGFELSLERSAMVTGNAAADSIQLEMLAVVTGTIACNNGSGVVCTGLGLPVFPVLPPFQAADVRPQATNVAVGAGQTVSLPAGEYGDVTIAQTGTLVLLGGIYDLRSVSPVTTAGGQCPYPCRSVMFAGPSDVRVQGRFDTSKDSCVAPGTSKDDCPARTPPAVGALSGATGILYVGGANGGDGSANALPPAATVGKDSVLAATVYAPNGTVLVDQSSVAVGALLGRHVKVDRDVNLKGDSFFGNRPPTADPQEVFTLGAASIDITLTGSDPNGDSLAFSHVAGSGPNAGTLSAINPIQEDGQCSETTATVCDEDADCPMGETCVLPPITSALVTYFPTIPADEAEDGFRFRVTDPSGAFDEAQISINPPGDPTEPPPVTAVSATPTSVETLQGTPVAVTLAGQVPSGFSLTFTIVSGPSNGGLGSITQVSPNNATVTYTPAGGFTGTDSFLFRAAADLNNDGDTTDPGESATATATILVAPAAPTQADNQTVTTPFETEVEITLTGTPGSGGLSSPRRVMLPGEAAFLEGAVVAGGVTDSDGDGAGDAHDPLPGPSPLLRAAAVNVGATGQAVDAVGDAEGNDFVDPSPDLVSADVGVVGGDLVLTVQFADGTFDSQTTRAVFVLDTDQNVATGCDPTAGPPCGPGSDDTLGWEFRIDIPSPVDPSLSLALVRRDQTDPPGGSTFVRNVNFDFTADGMTLSVPLADLDGDDGVLDYKVFTTVHAADGNPTDLTLPLDFMPDLGLPPATTGEGSGTGVRRLQIEWDVSALGGLAGELESAEVLLTTLKGPNDTLDTTWLLGTEDQDGALTDDDFEAPVDEQNPLATMPVPDVPDGTEGSFSFDVLAELTTALELDRGVFSIQGRVDGAPLGESFQQGLQVRTTADGNLPDLLHPQLALATPGAVAPLTFTVLTLPKTSLGQPIGTLKNSLGALITSVPALLPSPLVTFTPAVEFTGVGSFNFQASDGLTTGNATVTVVVESGFGFGDCLGSETFCNQGRIDGGGGGLTGGADTEADVALTVKVKGRGDVSSHPRQIKAGRVVGLFCAAQCTAHFPDRETVALYARPAEAGWVFAGWGGDCSGRESMTLVQMTRERECTATFVRERGSRKKE